MQRAEQRQRKAGLAQRRVETAAKNTLYRVMPAVYGCARQQCREAQRMHLAAPGGQRCAVRIVRDGLRRDKAAVQRVKKLPLLGIAARGRVITVCSIGVKLPEKFLSADGRCLQRKGGAVGRTDRTDRVKVKFCVQAFDLAAAVHRAAGGLQHKLAEGCRHRCRVGAQARQPHSHRGAAFAAVFKGLVHQALIGKGEQMLHSTLRWGGRGVQAVPQCQNMYGVVPRQQLLYQTEAHQGVGAGGVLHTVQNK